MSGGNRIAILGAGAWGTALANVLATAGRSVTLWSRSPELAAELAQRRAHPRLPGIPISRAVDVSTTLAAAVAAADVLLLAVPAQRLRDAATALVCYVRPG